MLVNSPRGFPTGARVNVKKTGDEVHRWITGKPLDFTSNNFCESCNNGWMSEIENRTIPVLKPMIEGKIEGEQIYLNRKAQHMIALWAGMRAMVIRSSRTGANPPEVEEWAQQMFRSRKLPRSWHVWIGAYAGRLPAHYESNDIHPFTSPERSTLDRSDFRGFVVSLIAGYLAVKVAALSRSRSLDRSGSAIVRIAPFERPRVKWPPDGVITDDSIVAFYEMGLTSPSALSEFLDEIRNS